jgi:hypothetical protein
MGDAPQVTLLACGRDPHIEAVTQLLNKAVAEPSMAVGSAGELWPPTLQVAPDLLEPAGRRGFIRGLPQPPTGLMEVEAQAWTDLVEAVAHDPGVEWLSSLSAIRVSDNKINQLRLARQIGVPFPKTLIGAKASDIASALGPVAVIKPLGPGVLRADDSATRVFYSTKIDVGELEDEQLARAPVIAQEPLDADMHLRVVTVEGRAWCAALDAGGLPLDWREALPSARKAWRRLEAPGAVRAGALALAREAKLGFSSQDWIVERERQLFLDLNPNGGWLFLPASMRDEITQAIVSFLLGESG